MNTILNSANAQSGEWHFTFDPNDILPGNINRTAIPPEVSQGKRRYILKNDANPGTVESVIFGLACNVKAESVFGTFESNHPFGVRTLSIGQSVTFDVDDRISLLLVSGSIEEGALISRIAIEFSKDTPIRRQ